MSELEVLLRKPSWRKHEWAWKRLTTGDTLFCALHKAVQNGTVGKAAELLDEWRREFVEGEKSGNAQIQYQWNIVHALLTCAKIAELKSETVARLPGLLWIFDPNADVPDGIACQAASLNSSDKWPSEHWKTFVRQGLYELTWQSPLSPEWAWDVVTTMWDSPRPVARSESLSVLVVAFEAGMTATLTLEQLTDEGTGVFYPDPQTMSFVTRDDDFQEAEQNAVAYVRETETMWQDEDKIDVRWKITRQDGQPFTHLTGGSAGGAFALGLAKLFAGE